MGAGGITQRQETLFVTGSWRILGETVACRRRNRRPRLASRRRRNPTGACANLSSRWRSPCKSGVYAILMFMAFGSWAGVAGWRFQTHPAGTSANPSQLPGGRPGESGVYANLVQTIHDVGFLCRRDH